MNEKTLKILEFNKIREKLAGLCCFSVSHDLAMTLTPSCDPQEVASSLKLAGEAGRLLDLDPDITLSGVSDVREALHRAGISGLLDPGALNTVRNTVSVTRSFRERVRKQETKLPVLWSLVSAVDGLPGVSKEIERCINDRNEVLDSASPELLDIRRRIKMLRDQITLKLESIVKSSRGTRLLQEPLVTQRDNRFVVPVKVEMRRELKGIVHDMSDSGATIFVEPMSVVEDGNDLRELEVQEDQEIKRILRSLSGLVSGNGDALLANQDRLARTDLLLAKAKFASSVRAAEPQLGVAGQAGAGALKLVSARHPLLKGKVVPIDVQVGGDYSVLVITGPNMGGKTVAMKTLGLLTLMAQAGVLIPASDQSVIPVFDAVFADIGDEQSIEQAMSTFSWHMGNVVEILAKATSRSLVLVDELGTGTDPSEGAALARSILLDLLKRRIVTVATTHHLELKAFANATPGVKNASVEFDPKTLAPTYRLVMGLPGRSNALAIATNLGMPAEIVQRARDMLSGGERQIEDFLGQIESERQKAAADRKQASEARAEATRLRQSLKEQLETIEKDRAAILKEARDEIQEEVYLVEKRLRRLESVGREMEAFKKQVAGQKAELTAIRKEVKSADWAGPPALDIRAETEQKAEPEPEPAKLAVGDQVMVNDLGRLGSLLSLPDDQGLVEVQVGELRLKVGVEFIELRHQRQLALPDIKLIRQKIPPPPLELHLRGKRAEEAITEIEQYLNDACVARLSRVRLVHGKGGGVLREIVREILAKHPLVKTFYLAPRVEGGDGVTIAELAV